MAVMTSFKRTYACTLWLPGLLYSVSLTCFRPVSIHTSAGDFQTLTSMSGSVSCGVTAPLPWVLLCIRFSLCPPRVCFPGGSQSFCRIPSLGNLMWALKFLQQWENFFGFNCSPVCGLSARGLYDGANGNLLQEDLCHMPRLSRLLKPESLSSWQVTAYPCLCRKHSKAGLAQCLVGVTVPFPQSWCTQGFVALSKPLCRSEI